MRPSPFVYALCLLCLHITHSGCEWLDAGSFSLQDHVRNHHAQAAHHMPQIGIHVTHRERTTEHNLLHIGLFVANNRDLSDHVTSGARASLYGLKVALERRADVEEVHVFDESTWEEIGYDPLDLVLVCHPSPSVSSFVHKVRRIYPLCKILFWSLDAVGIEAALRLHVDGYLSAVKHFVPFLERFAPTRYVLLGIDLFEKPTATSKVYMGSALTFLGDYEEDSPEQIELLLQASSQNLAIYGERWDEHPDLARYWRGSLPGVVTISLFVSSSVVLGAVKDIQRRLGVIDQQILEAMVAGKPLLLTAYPEAEDLLGDSVLWLRSPGDVAEHMKTLRSDPKFREDLGQRAQALVRSRHLFDNRVEDVILFCRELGGCMARAEGDRYKAARDRAIHQSRHMLLIIDHLLDSRVATDARMLRVIQNLRWLHHDFTIVVRNETKGDEVDLTRLVDMQVYNILYEPADPNFWKWRKPPRFAYVMKPVNWDMLFSSESRPIDAVLVYCPHAEGLGLCEQYLDILRVHSRNEVPIVVWTDSLHWTQEISIAEFTNDEVGMLTDGPALRHRELLLYKKAHIVVMQCDEDKEALHKIVPRVRVVSIRDTLSAQEPGLRPATRNERSGVLFVGSDHLVNQVSINWFIRAVLEKVRVSLPEMRLYVAGRIQSSKYWLQGVDLSRLLIPGTTSAGILAPGYVDDLQPWIDAVVAIVNPCMGGTGFSAKNLVALDHGIPLITTTRGAKGLHLPSTGANPVLIADDMDTFADAIVELHRNQDRWQEASDTMTEHARRQFTRREIRGDLAELLYQIDLLPINTVQARTRRETNRFVDTI